MPTCRGRGEHQSDDLTQPDNPRQEIAVEEPEFAHAIDEKRQPARREARAGEPRKARAPEMMGVAVPDRRQVDLRPAGRQCLSPSPIRRWRTRAVSVSMMATVTRIITRIAETSE